MGTFSGWIEQLTNLQFRKDQSGRLVFLPYGPRRAGYYLESGADGQRIRSLVSLYAVGTGLIQLVGVMSSYIIGQALIFPDRPTSLAGKLEVGLIAYAISSLVLFILPFCLLRKLYKELIPGFCSSLTEAGPESMRTLEKVQSPQRVRMILLAVASMLILAGALIAGWFVYFCR